MKLSLPAMVLAICLLAVGQFVPNLVGAPAHAAEAESVTVEVSKRDCRRLVRHRASADVAYKPGVDARGRPVVPADLPGTQVIKGPNKITISITKDVLAAYGVGSSSSFLEGNAELGKLSYDIKSGKMEFNGQPLTSPEMVALADACDKAK